MVGPVSRISLRHRGAPASVDFVRTPRPDTFRAVADPAEQLAHYCLRLADREKVMTAPPGTIRCDWSSPCVAPPEIHDLIPVHPAVRHHAVHRHAAFAEYTPTAQRVHAARTGRLSLHELLKPLPLMYWEGVDQLLSGGCRVIISPVGSERPVKGPRTRRTPAQSGARFLLERKLILLHALNTVDPAFGIAQIIDNLRFTTDADDVGDRFGLVFPPWHKLHADTRECVRDAWVFAQVYLDALRHATALRELGYTVAGELWTVLLDEPETAPAALVYVVIENFGLADQPWSTDLIHAMNDYPLRTIRDGR